MVAIKPTNPKKVCSLCGNRVRGKKFAYYRETTEIETKTRRYAIKIKEYIPICKSCDSLINKAKDTISRFYKIRRVKIISKIPREIVTLEKKERKKNKKK
jgi:hypothetical protein